MFEQCKIQRGAIKLEGITYSAPELQWMHGQTVRVSQSDMYPRAIVVFKRHSYSFICVATTDDVEQPTGVLGAVAERIARRRKASGPAGLRAYALDEWIGKIGKQLAGAERDMSYGNRLQAMNGLLKVAASCVECLQHHIDKEAGKAAPALKQVFKNIETADPAETESAA